jgi:ribosomal protein S6
MGLKKLGYKIKKHAEGIYYLTYFTMPSVLISKLEYNLNINFDILKFMIVKEYKITKTVKKRFNKKRDDRFDNNRNNQVIVDKDESNEKDGE